MVFGLTQPWLEPTTYGTWREHTNHYTIDEMETRGTVVKGELQ